MNTDNHGAPLTDGARYDVAIGPAVWRDTKWDARAAAFMLNDRGGVPWRFVTSVLPAEPSDPVMLP
ncbi:hypothetical protein [Gemmatimonas sp.]